jgi:predicted membrane channel-forming protein YqfA (hemolysin III family)
VLKVGITQNLGRLIAVTDVFQVFASSTCQLILFSLVFHLVASVHKFDSMLEITEHLIIIHFLRNFSSEIRILLTLFRSRVFSSFQKSSANMDVYRHEDET